MTRHELEALFARVLEWPEERQQEVLAWLRSLEGAEIYRLTPEERKEVLAGLAEAERGEFATDEEMEALWKKCGL